MVEDKQEMINSSGTDRPAFPRQKTCSGCGVSFSCGPGTGADGCWCNDFPPVVPLEDDKDCQCNNCLKQTVIEKIKHFTEDFKAGKVENSAPAYAGQTKKLVPDIDYTMENGLLVFSSWYLLKRGYCCGNGCRNCPY